MEDRRCSTKYELKSYCEQCPPGGMGISCNYAQNDCEVWHICMNCIEINCTANAPAAEKVTTEKAPAAATTKAKDSFLPG